MNLEMEFRFILIFSAILRLSRDQSIVSGGGNWSTQWKSLPTPKSLVTFSHAPARNRTQAVVRDDKQSVAVP